MLIITVLVQSRAKLCSGSKIKNVWRLFVVGPPVSFPGQGASINQCSKLIQTVCASEGGATAKKTNWQKYLYDLFMQISSCMAHPHTERATSRSEIKGEFKLTCKIFSIFKTTHANKLTNWEEGESLSWRGNANIHRHSLARKEPIAIRAHRKAIWKIKISQQDTLVCEDATVTVCEGPKRGMILPETGSEENVNV